MPSMVTMVSSRDQKHPFNPGIDLSEGDKFEVQAGAQSVWVRARGFGEFVDIADHPVNRAERKAEKPPAAKAEKPKADAKLKE